MIVAWRASPGVSCTSNAENLILGLPSSRAQLELGESRFEVNRNNFYLMDYSGRTESICRSLEPVDRVIVRIYRPAWFSGAF